MEFKIKKLFALLIVISFLGIASAQTCTLQTTCNPENTILKLSSTTNAHGEVYDGTNYNQYLCCDFTGTHTCDGSNKIVGLSSPTNAHAEVPNLNNYNTDVCFGDLSCTYALNSCPTLYPIEILSLFSMTNSHLGIFSNYGIKICCGQNIVTPICGNGVIETGEGCDDGNLIDGDGCSSTCTVETLTPVCGNSIIESGETCDSNFQSCSVSGYSGVQVCNSQCDGWNSCQLVEYCGDNILNGNESCDDGNLIDGDGCSSVCEIEDNDDTSSKKKKKSEEECYPNWQCTDWSGCEDGRKTRTCVDYNDCGDSYTKPDESMSCEEGITEFSVIDLSKSIKEKEIFNSFWVLFLGLGILLIILLILLINAFR